MSKHTHETTFEINAATVLLKVGFNFIPHRAATGPTYSSGGDPYEAAEVDVTSLEWSRQNKRTNTVEWHTIEGALFELIAEDEWLYVDLCDAAEADDMAAREHAAEQRAEFAKEYLR